MRGTNLSAVLPEQNGVRLLGDIFFWRLPRLATHAEVGFIVDGLSSGSELRPFISDAPTDAEVLRRVVHVAREGGAFDVTRVENTKATLSYSVAEKHPDVGRGRTDYEHRSLVVLDCAQGAITVDGVAGERIAEAWLRDRGLLGRQEWTSFCLAVVRQAKAVRLRERGGIYWAMPETDGTPCRLVRDLDQVLRAFGGRVGIIPIYDTAEGHRALADESRDSFSTGLAELREEVNAFDARTRTATLEDRLARLSDLRTRTQFVATLLREGADRFETDIATLERRCQALVLGLAPDALDERRDAAQGGMS